LFHKQPLYNKYVVSTCIATVLITMAALAEKKTEKNLVKPGHVGTSINQ